MYIIAYSTNIYILLETVARQWNLMLTAPSFAVILQGQTSVTIFTEVSSKVFDLVYEQEYFISTIEQGIGRVHIYNKIKLLRIYPQALCFGCLRHPDSMKGKNVLNLKLVKLSLNYIHFWKFFGRINQLSFWN